MHPQWADAAARQLTMPWLLQCWGAAGQLGHLSAELRSHLIKLAACCRAHCVEGDPQAHPP